MRDAQLLNAVTELFPLGRTSAAQPKYLQRVCGTFSREYTIHQRAGVKIVHVVAPEKQTTSNYLQLMLENPQRAEGQRIMVCTQDIEQNQLL